MNNKQASKIIKNYKPHKGFFDLSKKPTTLSKIEYASILKLQNFLAEQNTSKNIKYLKEFNPSQFKFLQELSSEVQQRVIEHWGDKVFI